MYINRYQKYMLELLDEYGCLKKSQLAFTVINNVENRLKHVDGYLSQLHRFDRVHMAPCGEDYYVSLPGIEPDYHVIQAFDVLMEFNEQLVSHERGKSPVAIRLYLQTGLEKVRDVYVIPVDYGNEKILEEFAQENFSEGNGFVIFLVFSKQQMNEISPECDYSFAIKNGEEIIFFDANKE